MVLLLEVVWRLAEVHKGVRELEDVDVVTVAVVQLGELQPELLHLLLRPAHTRSELSHLHPAVGVHELEELLFVVLAVPSRSNSDITSSILSI